MYSSCDDISSLIRLWSLLSQWLRLVVEHLTSDCLPSLQVSSHCGQKPSTCPWRPHRLGPVLAVSSVPPTSQTLHCRYRAEDVSFSFSFFFQEMLAETYMQGGSSQHCLYSLTTILGPLMEGENLHYSAPFFWQTGAVFMVLERIMAWGKCLFAWC